MTNFEDGEGEADFVSITPEGESFLLHDPQTAETLLAEAEQTLVPGKPVESENVITYELADATIATTLTEWFGQYFDQGMYEEAALKVREALRAAGFRLSDPKPDPYQQESIRNWLSK